MAEAIGSAVSGLSADLTTIATAILPVAVAGLLVWVGFRLAAKLTNRGVGK